MPVGIDKVDFEAEVVVVIGRTIRAVEQADVWQNIAGVTMRPGRHRPQGAVA